MQENTLQRAMMHTITLEVLPTCPDCGTPIGKPHQDGCDVARCTACGNQRISCQHSSTETGWGQIWTGVWPGKFGQEIYNCSLNELYQYPFEWNKKSQMWVKHD